MAEGKKEREMDESLLLQIRVVENRGKKDWIDFKTTKKTEIRKYIIGTQPLIQFSCVKDYNDSKDSYYKDSRN